MKESNGKIYNEQNEVAVIISTNYGAGWSTWNTQYPECLFDPDCVRSILSGERNHEKIAQEKWADGCWSGENSDVVWVPVGTKFIIHEYDGLETVVDLMDFNWKEA